MKRGSTPSAESFDADFAALCFVLLFYFGVGASLLVGLAIWFFFFA